jgi:CBS domain-containing protein
MGQNPLWRKRISEWTDHVSLILQDKTPFTIRYLTLIFDSAPLGGKTSLFDTYLDHAFQELSLNHAITRQMHDEEEARHKVPLGLLGNFITEKNKTHKGRIDMKRSGLIFIIETARVLALKNGIRETSTLGRIQALVAKGVIQKDDSEYFENAYRVILYQTLRAQVDNYLLEGTQDYYLNPHELSERHQALLKEAFKAVSDLQDIVATEFGELIL